MGRTFKDQKKFDRKKREKEGAIKAPVKREKKHPRIHEIMFDEDEDDFYDDE